MAFPDWSYLEAGTAVTWAASGGNKTLTLTSLASGSVREGDKSASLIDATNGMPALLVFRLEASVAVAVTARPLALYVGPSPHATAGTDNPGQLTGADATLTNGSELLAQLDYVGALIFSNATGTTVQKKTGLLYKPVLPYIIPVLHNDSGQALGSTAGDHKLVMTPYYRKLAD